MYTVSELVTIATNQLREKHIRPLGTYDKPVIVISNQYPGVWLEHCYDAVMWAKLQPDGIEIMKNTLRLFMHYQKDDGQLPCFAWDKRIGYCQIQECVSFAHLCVEAFRICGDYELLKECYRSCCAWESWLCSNRMVTDQGLVEMFVGYDTGHDNSSRLNGLSYPGNYNEENASILPPDEKTAPILAVDLNCNYYATLQAIYEMESILGISSNRNLRAAEVKQLMMTKLYDEKDAFFYDVDRHGNKRKYLSSTILHLFLEHVLDPNEDRVLINEILKRHVLNPDEFWTSVPFPSMAANEPTAADHKNRNCWGYYSQALIALRCTLWMDDYGLSRELDEICRIWVEKWTQCFDELKFGQELDPHTGRPTKSSEWYSSCMLFYIWAARRLGL